MWTKLLMLPVVLVVALVWARAPSRNPAIAGVMITGLTSDWSRTMIPGVAFVCRSIRGKKTCSTDVGGQPLVITFIRPLESHCSAQFAGAGVGCAGSYDYAPQLKPFVRVRVQPMSTPRPYALSTAERLVHALDTQLYRFWPIAGLLSAAVTAVTATLAIAKRLRPPPPERVGERFALLVCIGFVLFCGSVVGALLGFVILGYED